MSDAAPPNGYATWNEYWTKEHDQSWRTEPEIEDKRQRFLVERRAITPDIEKGIYPFRDESGGVRLSRGDVEWLLSTHESGGYKGPVDWNDPKQRGREGLDLRGSNLVKQELHDLPLTRMRGGFSSEEVPGISPGEMPGTSREQREMAAANMRGVSFARAHLEGASLRRAHLEGADLTSVHLEGAYLYKARFEGTYLRNAHLSGANLQLAFFDEETALDNITLADRLHGGVRLVDVHWGGVTLAVVPWTPKLVLGDEQRARSSTDQQGQPKAKVKRLGEFEAAVRANRQLATALRQQGLNDEADQFAYRAQRLQREVLRRQGRYTATFGSWLLDVIAGHGYKPIRTLVVYLLAISCFAVAYFTLGQTVGPHLSPLGAFIFSMTSFHGRGFFPGGIVLDDPITVLAAFEAFIGLIIEVSFIATFTQRFFAR